MEDRHLGGRMNALAALEALLVDPHDQEQRDKAFDHAEVRHVRRFVGLGRRLHHVTD